MRAHLVTRTSAIALAALAIAGIAAAAPAHADSFLFDFNSLSDGAYNSQIESYMNGVLTHGVVDLPYNTSYCSSSNPCTGATGEQNYTGDGHVVGTWTTDSSAVMKSGPYYYGGSNWYIVPLTLGNTDGVGTSVEVQHLDSYDTYITNKPNVTSQFNMVFSNPDDPSDPFAIADISFDFQIFPEAANNPDMTFKFKDNNGVIHTVSYQQGVDPINQASPDSVAHGSLDESSKQLIGHLDISTSDYCGTDCYATALYFIDWPSVIGIDNLALNSLPPPPEEPRTNAPEPMSGALLFGGLATLWFARRRRTRA
jgi:hypothetical protein